MEHHIEVIERGVVAYRPDQLYGWPGLTRTAAGEIVAISSERKVHVDPFGRVVIHRSRDGGRTWDLPQEIYNSELDDRDGTILSFPDGTLAACWFTSIVFEHAGVSQYQRRARRVTRQMRQELLGHWMLRSTDGGRTWEDEPTPLPPGGAAHCGPFLLSDGGLVTFGNIPDGTREQVAFFRSGDQGRTWRQLGRLSSRMVPSRGAPSDRNERDQVTECPEINERTLVELAPDRLVALFRCHPAGCEKFRQLSSDDVPPPGREAEWRHLVQYTSDDGGQTWSKPRHLPVYGYPAQLIKLASGALLCTYSDRRNPKTIRTVFSYDDGLTWDVESAQIVEQWPEDTFDMGYPLSLELSPGEILTIYYRYFWPGHPKHFDPNERIGLVFSRLRVT